jgi:hypothetical protein
VAVRTHPLPACCVLLKTALRNQISSLYQAFSVRAQSERANEPPSFPHPPTRPPGIRLSPMHRSHDDQHAMATRHATGSTCGRPVSRKLVQLGDLDEERCLRGESEAENKLSRQAQQLGSSSSKGEGHILAAHQQLPPHTMRVSCAAGSAGTSASATSATTRGMLTQSLSPHEVEGSLLNARDEHAR